MASGPAPGKVQILNRCVVEVMKGSGVRSFVAEHVTRSETDANSQAVGRRAGIPSKTRGILTHRDQDAFTAQPYAGKVKVGRYTVFGAVDPATTEGAYDQNQHHTLDSLAH